jgi:hypothetical protein
MSTPRNADSRTQWFQDNFPGADLKLGPKTMVEVIHTTEGTTWPDYEGGATAPNLTGLPPLGDRRGQWRAHFPDEKSSRALRNEAGGVQTNTLNAHQIELIGTCDPRNAKRWGGSSRTRIAGRDYVYWPDATERQLRWLARMLADLHIRHGLRLVAPARFLPYPASYGANGVRLSARQWSNITGVVGHQHVPENSHGDPGNIDMGFVLEFARKHVERRKKN